jgi:hypothetical protein
MTYLGGFVTAQHTTYNVQRKGFPLYAQHDNGVTFRCTLFVVQQEDPSV